MMQARVIKTEQENDAALARIEELMELDSTPGVVDELELLSTLVGLYEHQAYPLPFLEPLDAIRFRMEQQELKQKDLIPYIGSKSKVSEVLAGKRSLSLSMIRRLHEGLEIPLEILLGNESVALGKVAENSAEYRVKEGGR